MFNYNLTKILSIVVLGIGLTVLVGWFSDVDILKSLASSWVTMKFSTAVTFVMSGIILYCINESERKKSEYAKIFLLAPMIVILFFMATLLVSTFAGISTGIQDLFVKEESDAVKSVAPGVPSIGTMINFLLIYTCSIIVLLNLTEKKKILSSIAYVITAIGSLAVIGYAVNIETLYYAIEGFSTAMAFHTAISFILIGIGIILLTKNEQTIDVLKIHRISIKTKVLLIILPGTLTTLILMVIVNYSFSQNEITAQTIQDMEYLQIPVIVAISSLAIHASLFFEKSISNPISKLRKISNEISKGNLNVKIEDISNDEIGDLATSIENMRKNVKNMTNDLIIKNEHIEKTSRQKEEFSSMIAHELKTPLTPIQSYADILLSEKSGKLTEEQKRQIKLIRENASSLQRLITDFTDIQKLDLGVMKIHKENIHLVDAVNESIVNLRQEIEKYNIVLTTNLEEQVTCYCDKYRISQVLNNLLTNSIDFCPKSDGKIDIALHSLGENVEIIVEDNGIGMSKEQIDKVFTKFYQVDSSATREHGGTGLGLSICKGIVEGHGGTIKIESKIGKGTKVHIILPKELYSDQNAQMIEDEFETKQIE